MVNDLAATRNLTTEAVVSVVEGQYQIAVERQYWPWVTDLRKQLGFLLDPSTIDQFFPLPWKENRGSRWQKPTTTRKDRSEDGLVRDARLQSQDLPVTRQNADQEEEGIRPHELIDRWWFLRLLRDKSQGLGAARETKEDLLNLVRGRRYSPRLLRGKSKGLGAARKTQEDLQNQA